MKIQVERLDLQVKKKFQINVWQKCKKALIKLIILFMSYVRDCLNSDLIKICTSLSVDRELLFFTENIEGQAN